MAGLLFIVAHDARKELATYHYLEYALAGQGGDMILDRRKEDRRRIHLRVTPERRHRERRRREAMTESPDIWLGAGTRVGALALIVRTIASRNSPHRHIGQAGWREPSRAEL